MPLKTFFITAAAAVTAIGGGSYAIEQTKKQILYSCNGPSGHADLVKPNRYDAFSSKREPISVEMTTHDSAISHYRPLPASDLRTDVERLCKTGQPSANLRLEP